MSHPQELLFLPHFAHAAEFICCNRNNLITTLLIELISYKDTAEVLFKKANGQSVYVYNCLYTVSYPAQDPSVGV